MTYFHLLLLPGSPEVKSPSLLCFIASIHRERERESATAAGRKGATHSIVTAFTQAMKTPILINGDEQATHSGIFATSINGGETMHIEFVRGHSKESLMKNKVGVEKATKPCGVVLKLNRGEPKVKSRICGVVCVRFGTSSTRQRSVSKAAGEASLGSCYPSCPLAQLSSGSASRRLCLLHQNFQSTF